MIKTEDKNIIVEGLLGSVDVYDRWVAPTVSGSRPKPRYEVVHLVIKQNLVIKVIHGKLLSMSEIFSDVAWSSSPGGQNVHFLWNPQRPLP